MHARIALLPGDGVGPEVTRAAVEALRAVGALFHHEFAFDERPIGGAALRAGGPPLPPSTLDACLGADAVLLGAVGDPAFDREEPARRPEKALLDLRRALGVYANLRPARVWPGLEDAGPVKASALAGTDMLIVRELTGGLYYGEPRGYADGGASAFNTMRYSVEEIERLARVSFELARTRRKKLTSVDKANVLETSQLWREVFIRVAADYPDVTLDHLYVDNCAMQIILRPRSFDVIATENLFGDILSDEAGVLAGSLGMLPSASLGGRVGLYEPVHGSAPDIVGKGLANPTGAILSAAMLLRHSFQQPLAANAIEQAAHGALQEGIRTRDLAGDGPFVSTDEMTKAVIARLGTRTAA